MDTPCIPSEPDLRWDCIANITRVFTLSQVTLMCDRDIMSIDITDTGIETYEKLLATLLVCDWNMRAWTLLEAMRGRSSLYLLCADDKTVKLHDILQMVFDCGKADIVIPFLTRSYLLPPDDITELELFEGGGPVATEEDCRDAQGFISIGEAAVLLSHRHATRDEDDVLIWNLLIGDVERQDPVEMWKLQIGNKISTGALISSAPRIQHLEGFHWAPSRPTLPRRSHADRAVKNPKAFLAYDGGDSRNGEITTEGLRAKWLTHHFQADGLSINKDDSAHDNNDVALTLDEISNEFLWSFQFGILLQVCPTRGPASTPLPYQGSSNYLLAVCGSNDGTRWVWRGVFEWQRNCPLPPFSLEDTLLV